MTLPDAAVHGFALPTWTTPWAETPRIISVDVWSIDDFVLRPLDATQTNDFYEIVAEGTGGGVRSGCRTCTV